MISEADIESGQRTARPPEPARSPSPSLRELLRAYQRVQDAANDLPPVVMIRARHRSAEVLSRFRSLPRPRGFLRFFVAYHLDQSLAALDRRYNARAALNQASESDEHDHRAVQQFRRSLAPLHARTYLFVLVLLTLALSQLVVIWLIRIATTVAGEQDVLSRDSFDDLIRNDLANFIAASKPRARGISFVFHLRHRVLSNHRT